MAAAAAAAAGVSPGRTPSRSCALPMRSCSRRLLPPAAAAGGAPSLRALSQWRRGCSGGRKRAPSAPNNGVICWSGTGKPEVETQEPSATMPNDEAGGPEFKDEVPLEEQEQPELSPVEKAKLLVDDLATGQSGSADEVMALVEDLHKRLEESLAAQSAAKADKDLISDKYMRLNADFENFRKRIDRERIMQEESAKSNVIEQLLPVIDAFELARNNLKIETESEDKINNSYQGIYKQLVEVLQKIGLSVVETVGQPFDPEVMDAVMREPTDKAQDGTVLSEYRKGFKIGDQLLRPAMVQVAVALEESDQAPAGGSPPAGTAAAEETKY